MKTIPAITALFLLLPSLVGSQALACSMAFIPQMVPEPWEQSELPISASILVEEGWEDQLPQALLDPDGLEVTWETVTSAWDERVLEALPVGGWKVGDYLREAGGDYLYRILDGIDLGAPEVSIGGWSGQNNGFDPSLCGGGPFDAGVYLELQLPDEPVIHRFQAWDDEGNELADGLLFGGQSFIAVPQGTVFDVELNSVDLSGNETVSSYTNLQACGGCQGDIVSKGASPWAAALLLVGPLLGRRRREA